MKLTWAEHLHKQHQSIKAQGLWRKRHIMQSAQSSTVEHNGSKVFNFTSNDYLGLASESALAKVASNSSLQWGVGSGASHLVCGHNAVHHELEQALADYVGAEKALLFANGYMANLAIGGAFAAKPDLFLQDKLNHASLIDAGLSSKAQFRRYAHADVSHANTILMNSSFERLVLATDGVFSMDGDIAPLVDLNELVQSYNGLLVVDDAHGFGVLGDSGRGSLNSVGIAPSGHVLMMGTLGKAAGAYGAFVAGDKVFIEHMIQTARPYIYTTSLPPAVAAVAHASITVMQKDSKDAGENLLSKLNNNIAYFKQQADVHRIDLMPSKTAIQPVIIGDASLASKVSKALLSRKVLVSAIRPPTVPKQTARLRVTLSALHTHDQIDVLINELTAVLAEFGIATNKKVLNGH